MSDDWVEEYEDDEFRQRDRRRISPGRRRQDLVGWRLGQLENSSDRQERDIETIKRELYGLRAIKTHMKTEKDWALRVILFVLTIVTTMLAILQTIGH